MNKEKQANRGGGGLFDHLRTRQQSQGSGKADTGLPELDLLGLFPGEDSSPEEPSIVADVSEPKCPEPDKSTTALSPETRRALVYLLRQGVIFSSRKAKLFQSICRQQPAVRRHLAEVYLKLVLDERAGIAFVATLQKEEDAELDDFADNEIVSLISTRTLSLYDTLLLLVLRKHYQDRETTGEQLIVIDRERVESYLTPFLPLTNSTKADRRKLGPALERMVKKKILRKIRGSKDRYEITPVIRYVVSAEFLENMLGEYLRIAKENSIDVTDTVDSDNRIQGDNYE